MSTHIPHITLMDREEAFMQRAQHLGTVSLKLDTVVIREQPYYKLEGYDARSVLVAFELMEVVTEEETRYVNAMLEAAQEGCSHTQQGRGER